jgi:hypothetical protein
MSLPTFSTPPQKAAFGKACEKLNERLFADFSEALSATSTGVKYLNLV